MFAEGGFEKAAGAAGLEGARLVCGGVEERRPGAVLAGTVRALSPSRYTAYALCLSLCSALLRAPPNSCRALSPQAIKSLLLRTWVPRWTSLTQLIFLTMRSVNWMGSRC